jgi:hypothetical protein
LVGFNVILSTYFLCMYMVDQPLLLSTYFECMFVVDTHLLLSTHIECKFVVDPHLLLSTHIEQINKLCFFSKYDIEEVARLSIWTDV